MSFMQTIGSRIALEGLGKYLSGLSQAERATKGFGDSVEGASGKAAGAFGSMTKTVGLGALGAAGAIGGIGLASLKLAADFETTMSRIAGLTNTPQESIGALREQILKLSTEVAISPNELGAGAYFILSSGITDAATAMEVLRLSAKAATSGLGDTQTIANALTGVMNAYQLSAADAGKVTDTLVNIIKLGKGEPKEFADTLSFTVPLAAQMGIEFEQLGAVLATLTNQNLEAGQAGQYLRGVMAALLKPSQEAEEAFAALGLPIGKFREMVSKDFVGAMNLLIDKTGGSTEAIAQLFPNVEGLTAVLAAFANQGDATAANLLAIQNGAGALDTAFKAVEETAGHKFKQAMVNVQTSMIQLGAVALPIVAKVATGVSKVIETFIKLPGPVKKAVVIGGAVATVFLAVAGAALILAPGIIAIVGAFSAGGVAAGLFAAGLLPLLIVPVAIAAALVGLVAVAVLLEKKFHLFSETILPALSSAFQAVAAVVGPILQQALVQLTQLWTGLQPALTAAGVAVKDVGKVLLEVGGFLKDHPALLGAIAIALGVLLSPLIATAVAFAAIPLAIAGVIAAGALFLAFWDDIRRVVSNALDVFRELPIIGAIVEGVANAIVGRLQFIVSSFERLFDAVSNVVSLFKNLLQGDFAGAFDNLKALVGIAMTQVIDQFLQPLRDVKNALGPLVGELGPVILSGLEALPGLVGKAGDLIGTALIDGLVAGARAAWAVHEFIPEIPGLIVGLIGDLGGLLLDAGRQVVNGLIKGAKLALGGAAGFLSDLPSLLFGGGGGGDGSAIGASLTAQITDGLKGLPGLLFGIGLAALEALGRGLLSAAQALPGLLTAAGEGVVRGFIAGAEGAWAAFGDFFYGLPDLIVAAIGDLPKLLVAAGKGLIDGLVAAAEGAWAAHEFLPSLPGLILGAVGDLAGLLVKGGKALIDGLVSAVTSGGPALLSAAKDLPGLIGEGIKREIRGLKRIGGLLLNVGELMIDGLLKGITAGVPVIIGFVTGLPGRIVRGLTTGVTLFFGVGSFLIRQLAAGVSAAVPVLLSGIAALPGLILAALGDLAGLLMVAGFAVIQGFGAAISVAWEAADDFLYGLPDLILGILGDLGGLLLDAGESVIKGLFSGVSTLWEREKHFWSDLPGNVLGLIGDVSRTLYQLGDDILAGLWSGIKFVYEREKAFFSNLPRNLVGLIGDVSRLLVGVGEAFLQGLWTGINNVYNGLTQVLPTIGSSLANLIIGGFKGAWNGLAGIINSAIPNEITIPGVSIMGKTVFPETRIDLPDSPIPQLVRGANPFAGGLAIVGEAGPELAALPKGTRVWPHGETMAILDALRFGVPGLQAGTGVGGASGTGWDFREVVSWLMKLAHSNEQIMHDVHKQLLSERVASGPAPLQAAAPSIYVSVPSHASGAGAATPAGSSFTANINVTSEREAALAIDRALRSLTFSLGI